MQNERSSGCLHFINSRTELLEGEAVQQLEAVSRMDGVERAIALPDLHPGKGVPVGCAVVTSGRLYPHLLGNDVGCGMSLFQTDVRLRKLKLGKLEDRICGLEDAAPVEARSILDQRGIRRTKYDRGLGTIGGGNHFAELQSVEEILLPAAFGELGLDAESAVLLIHSGSRSLGEAIYQEHVSRIGAAGCEAAAADGQAYLAAHDHAAKWAAVNRELIAVRFLHFLRGDARLTLDLPHNYLAQELELGADRWVHRKGAVSSRHRQIVIPGSRGALTYLVRPRGDHLQNAFSLSHGAGRKWRRSECRKRLSERFEKNELLRTGIGSRVICEDTDLLFEEAPDAYKNVRTIVQALLDAGLVEVVATLKPILTYKTRRR